MPVNIHTIHAVLILTSDFQLLHQKHTYTVLLNTISFRKCFMVVKLTFVDQHSHKFCLDFFTLYCCTIAYYCPF